MKKLTSTVIILLISKLAFTQVFLDFSFHNYDPKLINPAYAGLLTSRDYQTQVQSKNIYSGKYNYSIMTAFSGKSISAHSGWGGRLSTTKFYQFIEYNGSAQYNYQFILNGKSTLSVGTQLGFSAFHLDTSDLNFKDNSDPSSEYDHNHLIGDFAIAFRANKFNAGISTMNLIVTNKTPKAFQPSTFYNLYVMHTFDLASWLKFSPSLFLVTTLQSPRYVELNGVLKVKDLIVMGTSREIGNDYSYQKYVIGVDIKKKLQCLVALYAGKNHTKFDTDGFNINAMLRWRIELPSSPVF